MWSSVLFLVCASFLFENSLSCNLCLFEEHYFTQFCMHPVKVYALSITKCIFALNDAFSTPKVYEAARVGKGYHINLRDIMLEEFEALSEDNSPELFTMEKRKELFQNAADNFIAAASKLPRVSGCIPPCGYQIKDAEYNCNLCRYDPCKFPLDCPLEEINVEEDSRTQMWCEVQFPLPNDIEVIWRFADQTKTQQMEEFEELTSGDDRFYNIPSVNLEHHGTYQCEIFSVNRSIVRLYYYLTVTTLVVDGHTELQDIFDWSLLPEWRLLHGPDEPDSLLLPPLVLATCLSAVLLLLLLSLGALYWSSKPESAGMSNMMEMKM